MKTAVYNQKGEAQNPMELNPKIFGIEKIDPSLVHFAVRVQRNNSRYAIAHTKNRGEVSGSGKKPWKQKGTGRARAGSIRSPLWKGGGVTFGPTSGRNYSLKINRSAFRKALFTVLTDKLSSKKLIVLENLENVAKTGLLAKTLFNIADKAGLGTKFALILDKPNKEIERASRNIQGVAVLLANQLNVLDLMKHDTLVMKDALPIIEKTYLK